MKSKHPIEILNLRHQPDLITPKNSIISRLWR